MSITARSGRFRMSFSRVIPTHRLPSVRGRIAIAAVWLAVCAPLAGCASLKDPNTLRKLAAIADFGSTELVARREHPRNPLALSLGFGGHGGPHPTPRAEQLLRRYDLAKPYQENPSRAIAALQASLTEEPSDEKLYTFAELAYIAGLK